jgi:GAF domain-containing protein
MRSQLTDIQGRTRQVALSGWANYVQGRGGVFGYDFSEQLEDESGGKFVLASDLTPSMHEALALGDVVVERGEEYHLLNAPILLRGEVLGAMSFTLPMDQPLSERQLELARTIAVRLGVALENTRLFEQSQAQAARERKATEVANALLTTTDMTALVSQAAESFYEALGAVYTRVVVKPSMLDVGVSENGNGHQS